MTEDRADAGSPALSVRRFLVSRDGRPVLEVADQPGPLVSTAMPAAGAAAPRHAFLTAAALDPFSENELRIALDQSSSTDDYIARLRDGGFSVVEQP